MKKGSVDEEQFAEVLLDDRPARFFGARAAASSSLGARALVLEADQADVALAVALPQGVVLGLHALRDFRVVLNRSPATPTARLAS